MEARVRSESSVSSDSTDSSITDSWMDDSTQIRILEEKIQEIKRTKELFLENFSLVKNDIESKARNLAMSVLSRRNLLKSQLQEIGNAKILEWDRQLNLCLEAEKRMKGVNGNVFNAVGAIQDIADNFSKKIGFIDSGKFEFAMEGTALLKKIKKVGRLSVSEPSLFKKVAPDLLLGGKGTENGRFYQPSAICCDSTGRILVSDCGNNRIQVFNEFGEFLFAFGKTGSNPGEFKSPTGLTVDKKFRILVSDKDNHRIQVFTYKGSFIHTFGEKGSKPRQFLHPLDVSVNDNIEIAVSDSGNYRIQLFDCHGGFITELGCRTTPALIASPRGITFQPDNSLLITDGHKNSVFIIGKEFTTVSEFKPENFFYNPQGIACNNQGIIAVTVGRNNIEVYDFNGNLCQVFGGCGVGPGEFDGPQGICFTRDDAIAVADVGNDRIQIFNFRFVMYFIFLCKFVVFINTLVIFHIAPKNSNGFISLLSIKQ